MTKTYIKTIASVFTTICAFVYQPNALAQQSYTFTNASATGSAGPTQGMVNTAYATTNLSGSVTVNLQGIQEFTIPVTGLYRITATGGQGFGPFGGRGASIAGDFSLTAGTVLKIIAGQQAGAPLNSLNQYGGGGGSFVTFTNNVPLIVAGGGGGSWAASFQANSDGTVSANGNAGLNGAAANGAGGTAGGGGATASSADGGAGITGNGGGTAGGSSFTNGAWGGANRGHGGFGGGGGTSSWDNQRGGGGGGYSGGGASAHNSGSGGTPQGGGGGSFNTGTNQTNTSGVNLGQGRVIITELCNINLTASGTNSLNPVLCAGNSLTLTTNAISNYSWSNGATTNSIVVSPTTNTTITVSGTSSLNCTTVASISITVSSALPTLTVTSGQNPICAGASTSLSATGAVTYTWSGGITNGQIITPSVTTNYTVSGQNGCGITTSVRTITVAPLAVSASANPTLVCEGYTTALSAGSTVNGYTWTPAVSALTGSNVIVAPMANTIYTVTASDGTCTGTQTVLVTTKTTPTIVPSTTFVTVCFGDAVTISASGAGTNGTYLWTPGNLTTQSITVAPGTSTLYAVVGTNSLNCSNNTSIPVQVVQGPNMTASTNKQIICGGASATLTATGATQYVWTGGPSTPGYTVTPATSTTYTVLGSGSTNSCVTTKTVQVNVFTPSVVISASTQICINKSATLTVSGANSYTWGSALGNAPTIVVTPATNTTYTVVALSNSVSINCSNTLTTFVQVNALPSVSISASKTTAICRGVTNTLTATGAQSYLWNTAATGSTLAVTPSVTTTYSVVGTDANGCEGTQQIFVNVSKCSGVNEASLDEVLSVYPNPNAGTFTIRSSSDVILKLYNAIGQELQTLNINADTNLEVRINDLSAGIYFLKNTANNDNYSARIIVTR